MAWWLNCLIKLLDIITSKQTIISVVGTDDITAITVLDSDVWNLWKTLKVGKSTNMFMKVFGGSKLMHAKNCFYSSRNLKIE